MIAQRVPYAHRQKTYVSPSNASPNTAEGRRAAVSLSPNAASESATALKKKSWFVQVGDAVVGRRQPCA